MTIYSSNEKKKTLFYTIMFVSFSLAVSLSMIPPYYQQNIEAQETDTTNQEKDNCIKTCIADHTILAFSYMIEEYKRPGIFDVEKARKYGIPEGQLYRLLQHGMDIEYKGRKLFAKNFTGPSRPGRKIGISGDTRPSK